STNLGIISTLRGRYAEAIGSWQIAVAAFERAGGRQGVAECYHNLAITYRLQAMPDRALAEADRAVEAAEVAGDATLRALALRGRAEIHVLRGELELARRDLDQVGEIRSGLADPVGYLGLLTYLSARSQEELEQSPMLTLLCGIAHSRLGRLDLGQQWAMVAQLRARMLGDRTLEVRALNVSGAVALERGGIDEAAYFFTRA